MHRVKLGPKVQEIKVARSAGVQVGNHNRQLNHYRVKVERPHVSLDHLLKGRPATRHAFERLVAHPHSWMANYAFRRHLSAGPERPSSRVLFADASRAPTVRITARAGEYGATVVDSPGVQVGDHSTQRNDFRYKLAGQEISVERMLHDRPDLARGLAMTVRHPGNPAVQRTLIRQISNAYARGSAPTLRFLDQDLPGSSHLSAEQGAGVQLGTGNVRTDRVSVDIRRLALTGWEATAERIAAKIDGPDAIPELAAPAVARPAVELEPEPESPWLHPFRRSLPDPVEDLGVPDPVEDLGPGIDPFSL